MGTRISRLILVHKSEFNTTVIFRNKISIPIESKLWTKTERGILVPVWSRSINVPYRHFSNFRVLKMSDFTIQNFHI